MFIFMVFKLKKYMCMVCTKNRDMYDANYTYTEYIIFFEFHLGGEQAH